jgi:hypothetical protein
MLVYADNELLTEICGIEPPRSSAMLVLDHNQSDSYIMNIVSDMVYKVCTPLCMVPH